MYTISEAAQRAGVSVDLLRAWERRYGVVTPRRTPSGYRLYDAQAIERVRTMRRLVDEGWAPSTAAAHLRDSPAAVAMAEPAPSTAPAQKEPDALVERFVEAAADIDARRLMQVLDEMGSRASFEPMVEHHLFPALRALGDAWASGGVSVAGEHAASSAAARWLGSAFEAAGGGAGTDARPILVGLPPGAHHELGALAFATACRRAGLGVTYLGADLPTADWVRAVRTTEPAATVIGVPTVTDTDAAQMVAKALRRASPRLPIAFGGRGAAHIRRATVLPDGLADAVAAIRSEVLVN